MSDALWLNKGVSDPSYTAAELRRGDAAVLFPGVTDSTGARGGVRPGHTPASLSSTTWTVHNIVGCIYPGLTTTSGPYRFQHAEESDSLDPADGTNDRIDALDLQIRDNDEDGSGFRDSNVVYTAGTPGASPSAPAQAANSIRLATILVPSGGSPSPTLTVVAPFTVAAGGILPVRDTTELPSAGTYDGLAAWQQDEQFDLRSIGGTFVNIRHEEVRAPAENGAIQSLNFTSERTILNVAVTIPAHWNGWDIEWAYTFTVQDGGAAASARQGVLRVRHGNVGTGTLLSQEYLHELEPAPIDQQTLSVAGGKTGLSGTGSQDIRLSIQLGAADDYEALRRSGYVRAIRTS